MTATRSASIAGAVGAVALALLVGHRRGAPPRRRARSAKAAAAGLPGQADTPHLLRRCRPMSAFRTASPASRSTTSTTTRGGPSSRWSGRRRRDVEASPRPSKAIAHGRSARVRDLQAAVGDLPRGRIGAGARLQQLRCRGRQPVRRDGAVRRRDHRIGVGDRRHRTGGHRRPRSAARRAERALRPHADALQSDRLRSHRPQSLLPARRAAAGAEPAARPPGHRLPDRIDRRQEPRGSTSPICRRRW